jgi:hypothetical protein
MISDDTNGGRRYHHNGDFSGEVIINIGDDELSRVPTPDGGHAYQVSIPFTDLLDIVARGVDRRFADERD